MKELKIKPIHIGILALVAGGIYFLMRDKKKSEQPLIKEESEPTSGGGGGGISYAPLIEQVPVIVQQPIYVPRTSRERWMNRTIVPKRKEQILKEKQNIITASNINTTAMTMQPSTSTQNNSPQLTTAQSVNTSTANLTPSSVQAGTANVSALR